MTYYLCAIFTLISAAVSFGFSIDAYVSAKKTASKRTDHCQVRSLQKLRNPRCRHWPSDLCFAALFNWLSHDHDPNPVV